MAMFKPKEQKKPQLGDVHFHPLSSRIDEPPFALYVAGNPTFKKYDNVPLTVMELRQKVISEAADKFYAPVWFTQCIDGEHFLPFASTLDGYPSHKLAVPVLLNAEFAPEDDHINHTWEVIIRIPLDGGGFTETKSRIRYARGHVLDIATIYPQ